MSIKLSDSIRVGQQKPLEDKYFNELVPYTSISQVNTLLPKAVRHIGLTVNINKEEYWYKDGIEDENLTFKSTQKTIEITREELYDDLIPNEKLEPNRLYKITGVESWCFSQHLIKAIYLKAITNNTLESEGVGEFYTPKYNNSDSNLGIWKGELLTNGMIDSLSYNIGDKVIWGNLFWENVSGNIGTNIKEYEGGRYEARLENWLSNDWILITPNDDESLYNVQFDKINYDFENDYIDYREDRFGNKNELSYEGLISLFPDSFIVDDTDSTFIYYVNSIALFQWGRNANFNNNISESIVLNCNYRCYSFKDNSILEKSIIYENNFLNVQFYNNNIKKSTISYNYLKNNGGIINNDVEDSQVYNNKYYIEISDNKLRNGSIISGNNDNNIIVNSNFSKIKGNNLDNKGYITSNIFVGEGKGVTSSTNNIINNIINNNSYISSNTIKNGSGIADNILLNFDEIRGNTLDTDSNIYRNKMFSSCKINNNILTGHGRIYGNQLDRDSEITLCKLRISPTTSYATTMKNNRLFNGKIQNVDFGDIVNPVGTNPNDPVFGGNELGGCFIENGSIIKDLTFPNVGGILIQFIRLKGYSEFKNITVNNSIRNVDFINTIFNETSDYSKLIKGNGYQTNGFTKTYIDGVLLQDRFDEKQDVLTEDNVGQFMDSELATKSTPTSGDTVLGRDSLTGKAVRIPTDQLGGGGSIDISGKLDKGAYTGTAQDLKTEIDGKANSSHTHPISEVTNLQTTLDNKVDKVIGKQLSTEDYTTAEKNKLSGIQEGAEVNVNADWNATSGDAHILNKPSTFTPSAHTHPISQVDNLQSTLNNKLDKGTYTGNASDLKNSIDNIQIGGRNYLLKSKFSAFGNTVTDSKFGQVVEYSRPEGGGDFQYVFTLSTEISSLKNTSVVFYLIAKDMAGNGEFYFGGWNNTNTMLNHNSNTIDLGDGWKMYWVTFVTDELGVSTTPNYFGVNSVGGIWRFYAAGVLKGNKATDWTPAPEDKQDVLTEDNVGSFMDSELSTKNTPSTGDTVLARDILTNKAVEIPIESLGGGGSGLELGETSSTAYRGDRGKIAYDHSQVTHDKTLVGLGNVDNTSDLNKPISTATQQALNNKLDKDGNAATATALQTARTLTIGNTGKSFDGSGNVSWSLAEIGAQSILTNPITGTGTTNYLSKFTASGTIGDSIVYDDGTNVGIGTTTLGARLDVKAQGALSTDIVFRVRNSTDTQNFLVVTGAGDVYNRGAKGESSSTFFGEYVGRDATGFNNNGFGNYALYSTTTGRNNNAFGTSSLLENTTGYSNNAFGTSSLSNNTTGRDNSAFGDSALYFNTTGNSNNAIGSTAGTYTNNGGHIEISNNSIYLGCDTRANANDETNQIVIGHSARGNGSNSVTLGNDSITKTVLKGQVIMGSSTSTPTGMEGAIYYNSTTKKHYGFNGTSWNALY